MQINAINQISNINYQKRTNRTSFRGEFLIDDIVYNKSKDIDEKIKLFLEQAIKEKRALVQSDIANEMNLNADVSRNRILNNPELRELWKQTIHRKPIKKKTKAVVHPKNTPAVNDLIIQIKSFLENAIKTNTPISSTDITQKLGITRDAFSGRIKGNPELSYLWERCQHKTRTNQSIESQERLRSILRDCVEKNEIIDFHEMSKRSGLTEQACTRRIARDEKLQLLWEQIKKFKSDIKTNNIETIKKTLTEYINSGLPISLDKIAEQTGFPVRYCKHKIEEFPKLNELWNSAIHKRGKTSTKAESEEINRKIQQALEEANKKGEYLKIEELSKRVGCKNDNCYGRIKRYPDLFAIWQKNNSLISDQYANINSKIQKEIEKAVSQKRAISFSELSAITGFSKSVCSNRIYSSNELKKLWNEMQKSTESTLIDNLQQEFSKAIENREKITYKILKEKYNITPDILRLRLKEHPELQELWNEVKQIKNQNAKNTVNRITISAINNKKMAEFMQNAINEGRAIFQKEIAQEVGISQGACKESIRRVPSLSSLWQKVEHKKISESSEELNNKIRSILEHAIENKQLLSVKDIAQSLGLTKRLVAGRFNINNDLSMLWNKLRENRAATIKELALLKIQKVPNQEIQKKLGINDESFKQLLDEYDRIYKMIFSHSDKSITREEYIKWATLTKREFELAVTKLFEKMGYKSGVTRYSIDGGIDIIGEKDGIKTYLECVHNLKKPVYADEVLQLQGCKHYFSADNVILAASSGVYDDGVKIIEMINKNTNNSFKIMQLEDIIKQAQKYNIDVENIGNVQDIEPYNTPEPQRKTWLLSKLENITDTERNEWQKLDEKSLINRVINIFEKQNHKITKISERGIPNSYLLEKDGNKTLIQYLPKDTVRKIEMIRALYGAKDVYGAKNVILFGLESITYASKDFISTINKKYGASGSFKILSLDKIISMYKKLK